ncbi:hypothetical protein RB195_008323 [Necator americanus]|uniref:Uncharacterized protein n=1 Tax=Necator americanus TaxID=51031 RepID=A0ABR1CQ06_NECAM
MKIEILEGTVWDVKTSTTIKIQKINKKKMNVESSLDESTQNLVLGEWKLFTVDVLLLENEQLLHRFLELHTMARKG